MLCLLACVDLCMRGRTCPSPNIVWLVRRPPAAGQGCPAPPGAGPGRGLRGCDPKAAPLHQYHSLLSIDEHAPKDRLQRESGDPEAHGRRSSAKFRRNHRVASGHGFKVAHRLAHRCVERIRRDRKCAPRGGRHQAGPSLLDAATQLRVHHPACRALSGFRALAAGPDGRRYRFGCPQCNLRRTVARKSDESQSTRTQQRTTQFHSGRLRALRARRLEPS